MSIRQLLQLSRPDFLDNATSLRVPSSRVNLSDPSLKTLLQDLEDTLRAHAIAVGLSAPQIGYNLRVSIINISKNKLGDCLVLINPEVVQSSGPKETKFESCMSLPHYRGPVQRREKIHVRYSDQDGVERSLRASGFLARVIFHELDHLDGILYVDRMSSLQDLEEVEFFKT